MEIFKALNRWSLRVLGGWIGKIILISAVLFSWSLMYWCGTATEVHLVYRILIGIIGFILGISIVIHIGNALIQREMHKPCTACKGKGWISKADEAERIGKAVTKAEEEYQQALKEAKADGYTEDDY